MQCLPCDFIKIETLAQVFSCAFCDISKNIFSYRTPPVAASVNEKFIFLCSVSLVILGTENNLVNKLRQARRKLVTISKQHTFFN